MVFYWNVIKSLICELLWDYFEGLISIDKKGLFLIIGNMGFILEVFVLDVKSVEGVLVKEIVILNYYWFFKIQVFFDSIDNNYFDCVVFVMWELLEKYVFEFFVNN